MVLWWTDHSLRHVSGLTLIRRASRPELIRKISGVVANKPSSNRRRESLKLVRRYAFIVPCRVDIGLGTVVSILPCPPCVGMQQRQDALNASLTAESTDGVDAQKSLVRWRDL